MAWDVDAVELLRVLINDCDETPTYTDERLIRVLVVGAFQLMRKAVFSQTFVVDIGRQTITPDPTDTTNLTNDENFVNLMCLKAACIIDTGSAIKAANNAIAGKDLDVAFDLKGVASSTLALLDKGYCATFEAAFDEYLSGSGVISAAVMGPFRIFARNYGPFPY